MRSSLKKHIILSKIYNLRLMSYIQIYDFIFKKEGLSERYCSEVLKEMVTQNLLEKTGFYKDEATYTISKQGISFLKKNGIIPIGQKDAIVNDNLMSSGKLKIKENYSKHQLSLNQFILEFECLFDDLTFIYYDEIFISSIFKNIRPDGVLKLNDTYYFLEMDMNSERKTRLNNKWENYRSFLNSEESQNLSIKVLFILGGNSTTKRKYELRKYIDTNLNDKISKRFDVIINKSDDILEYLGTKIRGNKDIISEFLKGNGYRISGREFSDPALMNFKFHRYCVKMSNSGNVVTENGEPLEFIIDDFTYGNMYIRKKIQHYPQIAASFKQKKSRLIKYIIIVSSEEEAYMTSTEISHQSAHIYYTTIDRLNTYDNIYEALFKISDDGTIYHFYKNNLRIPVEEQKIIELKNKRAT